MCQVACGSFQCLYNGFLSCRKEDFMTIEQVYYKVVTKELSLSQFKTIIGNMIEEAEDNVYLESEQMFDLMD
jgi:hypothetical protein